MQDYRKFYINGEFVEPVAPRDFAVIDPATEQPFATISLGSAADVDIAVAAARAAFKTFSKTSIEERIALLERIQATYLARAGDLTEAMTAEIGAPKVISETAQLMMGLAHFPETIRLLNTFEFSEQIGERTTIVKRPVGVCGLITPWNWPLNQILCKVLPALATGCTMILKPSEIAPINAYILAEIMHEAGVPPGVFNLINGDGLGVGTSIAAHPDIQMVSFTGSTRAGVEVAKAAAPSVKRVAQELGGKSANILLDDADFEAAVLNGVNMVMLNSGQTCAAPTRMIVPRQRHDEVCAKARKIADSARVVDPKLPDPVSANLAELVHSTMPVGPVVSEAQYNKIQDLIDAGIQEGADLVAGGPGKPDGVNQGYYVRPTIFGNVQNDMRIAQEEIFGPVLVIIPYDTEADAIEIANDSEYGLSGYVSGGTPERASAVAVQLDTGAIHINQSGPDFMAPFGGVKKSGNGREWGVYGFEEYLEPRALIR